MKPTTDFDHHRPGFEPAETFAELRRNCPMAWTEAHGGFWVVSRYDDVTDAARDDDRFRSAEGVTIPRAPFRVIPIEMDPPEFFGLRRVLNPPFSPGAVARLEPMIRRITDELIDGFIETGRVEFIDQLARPLPGRVTLRIVGFPEEEWPAFHKALFAALHTAFDGPDAAMDAKKAMLAGRMWQRDRIRELITHHREHPGDDDLTTLLMEADVDGRRLTDDELVDTLALVLDGGLDTTASSIGLAVVRLSQNPAMKQALLDDPALLASAVEEFLRVDTPVQGLARTAARDCEFAGQQVAAGERLLLLWASANRDDAAFEQPDDVILDRAGNRHITFGVGNHRCIGSHLARLMFSVALERVLARLPDFTVPEGGVERAPDVGTIYALHGVDAVFTPGPRVVR
jgi:cytochrome P450